MTTKDPKKGELRLHNLRDGDSVEYKRFDFSKIIRYRNIFSIKFIQLDYHAVVDQIEKWNKSDRNEQDIWLSEKDWNTVSKLITDYDGLKQLKNEIEILLKKMEEQSKTTE